MAKRRLTDGEIARVREWAMQRERQNYPNANIAIVVHGETDDNGEARYSMVIRRERVVALSQVPL